MEKADSVQHPASLLSSGASFTTSVSRLLSKVLNLRPPGMRELSGVIAGNYTATQGETLNVFFMLELIQQYLSVQKETFDYAARVIPNIYNLILIDT